MNPGPPAPKAGSLAWLAHGPLDMNVGARISLTWRF